MTTTKRSNPQTMLKAALVTGSLAASLLGTKVVARNDHLQSSGPAPAPVVITVPIEMLTASQVQQGALPAASSAQSQASPELTLALPPIPQAISPVIPPVTQTQSSK